MYGKVIINDVGPRDGLQNQPVKLSPAERVELISRQLCFPQGGTGDGWD